MSEPTSAERIGGAFTALNLAISALVQALHTANPEVADKFAAQLLAQVDLMKDAPEAGPAVKQLEYWIRVARGESPVQLH